MSNNISVIIPFYNSIKTLSKMLDSILEGDLIPSELILVDDGSTDSSRVLANKYSEKHTNIKVLSQNHSGVSAARNLGLSYATGDWISFLDADDYIEPNMYSLMLQSLNEASYIADGCICGYYTDKEGLITPYKVRPSASFSSKELLKAMFSDDTIRGFLFTRLFKKDLLKNLTFDVNISYCEDLVFQTQLFTTQEVRFTTVSSPLYHYVQRSDSATGKKLFDHGTFVYRPAYEILMKTNQNGYVLDSYNSILDHSMYTLLKSYHVDKDPDILNQIRLLQHEMKTHDDHLFTTRKRRLAYEFMPILYSYFLK